MPVRNPHQMLMRGKIGYKQPKLLHADVPSPVPKSVHDALADPHWRVAMEDELATLQSNHTWDLIPRPPGVNVVTGNGSFSTSSPLMVALDLLCFS